MTNERWSFDGHGINGSDEYKSRIATLRKPASNDREEWDEFTRCGKLMAAAPEVLVALEDAQQALAHSLYLFKEHGSFSTSIALKWAEERTRVVIAKAKGEL